MTRTLIAGWAPRPRFPFLITPAPSAAARTGGADVRLEDRQGPPLLSFFTGLIPIMDGLEAVRHLIPETGQEEWQRGITLTYEKLRDYCSASGLQASAEVGAPFDPTLHEALATAESAEVGDGCVSEVVQQGWLYRGKLLRFARVVVVRRDGSLRGPG